MAVAHKQTYRLLTSRFAISLKVICMNCTYIPYKVRIFHTLCAAHIRENGTTFMKGFVLKGPVSMAELFLQSLFARQHDSGWSKYG